LNFGREETEKYIKQLGNLTNGFIVSDKGGNQFNESLIKQQRYLTDIVGVSEEAAEAIMDMNAGIASRDVASTGKVTAEQLEKQLVLRANEAKVIEKLTGLKGVQRTIDAEIAAAGSETSLQYSKMPKTLGLAVMKSKALGLSMEQMAKTGDELLNIESSVGNELEYQLLSGKRLVDDQGKSLTNMYRQATLQGDMNQQADIMKKIMDSQGDVLENNMLARKQLATTLGVEEGTMAKMVQKRKLLKSMGAEKLFDLTGDALQKELNELGASRDDMAKIMEADDTRTTQDKMAESLRNIETRGILARFATIDTKTDKIKDYDSDKFKQMYTESTAGIKTALSEYKTSIGATSEGLKAGAKTFFNFQNQKIGGVINISDLTAQILSISGVKNLCSKKLDKSGAFLKICEMFTVVPNTGSVFKMLV
jgi:plasmid maintenance system antidote protein VapI